MEIVPETSLSGRDPVGLRQFLQRCQERASDGQPVFASISLRVPHIDPLAVLEAIEEPDEPHLFLERPQDEVALAGAEAVTAAEATGPERFARLRAFAEATLARTVAVGDLDAPLAGPTFLLAATFADSPNAGSQFPVATAFLPRWQVAAHPEGYSAVANARITADTDLDALALRILTAHERFGSFEYGGAVEPAPSQVPPGALSKEGGNDFRDAVARALTHIDTGRYEKIVLGRALDLDASAPVRALPWLTRLRERFPSCWSLSFKAAADRRFIAATPERLISARGGRCEVDAIAGSTGRGANAQEDARLAAELIASDKNQREHQAVVASIRSRLERLGVTVSGPPEPRLLRLGNVQHLRTPLRCTLGPSQHPLDLAAVLHPTPALGGRPREAAVPEIAELEGFPRGLFGGVLGWFNHRGDGDLLVGIRCAEVEGTRARLYAGAGVVAGSDPEKEFAETELKLEALRATL
ncbi:MAG: isochorismate synthase MenF [Opitutales bacterium]